ncbi:hypothetical protein [Tateyamaria sp. SN6-1]|uniref:hypothetical protein n=1 Tax=Tateyamaria sp. SN6-1 TaxID=3092148 RepID=UPI0039F45CE0
MRKYVAAIAVSVLCSMPVASLAKADGPQPVQQHNSNAVWFENFTGLSNASLVVSYPDGTVETVETSKGTPVFKLRGDVARDGVYRYELRAATEQREEIKNQFDNGRGDAARSDRLTPFYLSGHFTVSRGVIITPEDIKEE